MDRDTSGLTQMGGEGTDWIGLSRYISMPHVFQNMGEGTYFHSGYLAIRQAVAAKANITYKILFNDAVAMTGGQPVDGTLSVPQICQQMLGEGVRRVVITTDDPAKYQGIKLIDGVSVHERHELDRLQRELRDIKGVTVLIHDQVCAAEKRRRRKKKTFPDPARRLFINTAVCEGCGDCGTQSNCLSLVPVETPFGRKRAIDQSSCNKDYSCLDGFCPSFVSVIGGSARKGGTANKAIEHDRVQALLSQLPNPVGDINPANCNILVAGILSMAAHLEGRAASVLDITGLAQKGGTVISHIRLSASAQPTGAVRIDAQQADVAIFCDAVAATSPEALRTLRRDQTVVALNTYLAPTAEFTRNPQTNLDAQPFIDTVCATAGSANTWLLNAHTTAEQQFGDSILANIMMLGFAWQHGGIPVSEEGLMQALKLNGVSVELNQQAFRIGRLAAWQPAILDMPAPTEKAVLIHMPESLDTIMKRCRAALTDYQNAAYAQEYADVVEAVLVAEQALRSETKPRLAPKVAQSLYKLMAYKDEYEVARLFTSGDFRKELHEKFEGDFSLRFHLAPPLLGKRDPVTGVARKMTFGPGTEKIFKVLARGKFLRGSWLDIFSYTAERKMERRLIREYRSAILDMLGDLRADNFSIALELAELPQMVRGYGHIKAANVARYQRQFAELQAQLKTPVMDVNNISRAHA
jgi:indolepyruvate ferredoxin oxidoreductase